MSENYLMHHGIKGMKWGVRRYQNEDGTLTLQGRMRYGTKEERASAKKEYRDRVVKAERKIVNSNSFGETIRYNSATWRKAAKYMVDNDVSMEEAKKVIKNRVKRNTALYTIAAVASFIITPQMIADASSEFASGFKNGYSRARASKNAEHVNEYGKTIYEYKMGRWRKG